MIKGVRIKHLLSSSLWITVFIVRVGCIIEAHASTIEAAVDNTSKDSKEDLSSSLLRQSGIKKKIVSSSTRTRQFALSNLSSSTVKATTANVLAEEGTNKYEDDDSCSMKADGYYPNYGSDCTSYYFCAAGYQITYVCPPDTRYNEKSRKCEEEAKCSSKGHKNICNFLQNGYYTNEANKRKYFYCYNNAKVIDLMCDEGKIFNGNKCIFHSTSSGEPNDKMRLTEEQGNSCRGKPNGFYPVPNTGCTSYFYCIGGTKTELKCQLGLVFNGDVCVRPNRYNCPAPAKTLENSISYNSTHEHSSTSSSRRNTSYGKALGRNDSGEDKIYLTSESIADSLVDSTTSTMPTTTSLI